MGRVGGGSCYTRVPLHSKEIAYSRGSVEDVLRFSWVNILERCWLREQVDGLGPASRGSAGCHIQRSKSSREVKGEAANRQHVLQLFIFLSVCDQI